MINLLTVLYQAVISFLVLDIQDKNGSLMVTEVHMPIIPVFIYQMEERESLDSRPS